MSYAVLEGALPRQLGPYRLREIWPQDVEAIRRWRNAQLPILRQTRPITPAEQHDYFQRAVWPEFPSLAPRQVLLTMFSGRTRVGYGGLTNIDWHARRAELSFLAAPDRSARYADDFGAFLTLAVAGVAFEALNLHRVWHETYAIRSVHVSVLEHNGFACEGRLRDHVMIEGRYVDSLVHGRLNTTEETID